jgi:hypothetical protein
MRVTGTPVVTLDSGFAIEDEAASDRILLGVLANDRDAPRAFPTSLDAAMPHGTYDSRSATMGSTLVARQAGM